jgi:DNA invertase Pin-like site-specific DNA recombinase
MTTAQALRAVTYRRVSSLDQVGGTSPETQLERGLKLIAEQDWKHVGDFFDPGVSGAKQSRPELDRLFEFCRAGLADIVLVGDLSRLSRDMRNSLNFEHELRQLGVQVIDVDNPNADELAKMFSYLQNHWMREQIRRNTHRGILAVAEAGYWPVGTAPFGWRIVPAPDNPKRKIVVVHEAEAATIRKAVDLVVDDRLSCWEAARQLNAPGYPPRNSARWNNVSLRWVLKKNEHLAGEWVLRKAGREIPVRGPAIISAERLHELRNALAETSRVKYRGRVYPLTGRVVGACGSPYHGLYRSGPDRRDARRYECRYNDAKFNGTDRRCYCPMVDADWREETVWTEVSKVLSDPERLLELAQQYLDLRSGELGAEADQLTDLDRQLTTAKRRRTNLALAAADTGPEAIADALAEINREIETLVPMRAQARAWAQANAERAALVRNVWRLTEVARERLDSPTPEWMREVFAALDIRAQLTSEGVRRGRLRCPPGLRISGVLPIGNLRIGASSTGRSRRPPRAAGTTPRRRGCGPAGWSRRGGGRAPCQPCGRPSRGGRRPGSPR